MSLGVLAAESFFSGVLLGSVFFGGLWWTVRRALSSATPQVWFILSFPLRTGVVLGGLFVATQGDWRRLAACLCGFLAARAAIRRLA